ncbi:endonuclease NucS [Halorhabdus rudnickae]|uniref:endonuclease NucS n=1 Tax=Halorhabdus rudnickae TaxID=1775544 RepID=UPI0010844F29|nr:endonuclease NucS [Halorhabdus rudnickae]
MTDTGDQREGVPGDDEPDPVVDPSADAARQRVARAVDRGDMVTIFGRCRVEYDGRATSTLGPGDRLLVLKPDGTALVHTDEGHQPVNWQPPGSTHEVELANGNLRIESHRTGPEEHLEVTFESIRHVTTVDVTDPEELSLSGTEEDLRERVLADPGLIEPGFEALATERATPAGAIDIYGEDEAGRAVVVELKRRRVGPDAVGQLSRYVDALARDLHADREIRGILVAPSATDRARELLAQKGMEFVVLDPTSEKSDGRVR